MKNLKDVSSSFESQVLLGAVAINVSYKSSTQANTAGV